MSDTTLPTGILVGIAMVFLGALIMIAGFLVAMFAADRYRDSLEPPARELLVELDGDEG